MKPKLATTGRWDPSQGKQYLSVSRIPSVTASSVVDYNAFKKVQKFMMENNYQIIPTSPDGHEYLTEFGRPQPIKWDNKCFACVFLKARELCQGVFLDRFPYTLSEFRVSTPCAEFLTTVQLFIKRCHFGFLPIVIIEGISLPRSR